MPQVNSKISKMMKFQIYNSTLKKIFRGYCKKIFFKESKGLLFIGKHVDLINKNSIKVGKNVKFEDYSEIQGLSKHGLTFSDNVTIGRNVQIRPSSYYGVGTIGWGLKMGENSSIGPNSYVGCAGMVSIGKNVMMGPNVTIIAENHNFNDVNESIKEQGVNQKGIVIQDNVWIGANVIILDGVTIGSGVIIGAGTLVNKSILKNTIYLNKRDPYLKRR